ncbi:TetR family transcriptional regulator [Streptomyces sp. Ru73]|uniref:TetR/AcrR family transcriptional regulator n=1 Tax=Streptomyces sp. Ru73 TaxID=2080748 RepID=UPI000CDD07CB|nr:TetR/AcrR family transcriptional regulator [Streptomyces sp. Ru73]POX35980.1 TetR family transcriptional regulator [Streptomyces sp. Ru73]
MSSRRTPKTDAGTPGGADRPAARGGRPKDPELDGRVLDAAAELLAELGYLELTIEKVATRAGVTRKTVYNRWANKSALVGELLIRNAEVDHVPDLGDTRAEMRTLFDQIVRDVGESRGRLLSSLWATIGDPAVLERFRTEVLGPRRQYARAAVQRGVARGDLPADIDVDLLIDMWSGTVMFRTEVRADVLLASQAEAMVDLALSGAVPRLPRPGADS